MKLIGRTLNALQTVRWRLDGEPISYEEMFQWEKSNHFRYTLRNARWVHHYDFNLTTPRSFNEKIVHRRLFSRDPIWPIVTDKIGVREWAEDNNVTSVVKLPDIIGIYDDPEQIPRTLMGEPVVIKAAWASGLNVFMDKAEHEDVIWQKFSQWHSARYGIKKLIWAAQHIPRRFIAEKKLQLPDGEVPPDYKFFVFRGRALFCQIDFARFRQHRRSYYDYEGNDLGFTFGKEAHEGPADLDMRLYKRMWSAAELIGRNFDFVRVDLYAVNGELYLGELTQSPGSGFNKITPTRKDFEIGEVWEYDPNGRSYTFG